MTCEAPHLQLDAFVDGELDASAQLEVEQHVACCSECQDEVVFARALKHELRAQYAGAEAPAGLQARVREALKAADEPAQPSWQERAWSGAFMAAAAAVLLVLGRLVTTGPPAAVPSQAVAARGPVVGATTTEVVAQGGPALAPQPTQVVAESAPALGVLRDVVAGHVDTLPSEAGTEHLEHLTGWFRDKLGFRVASVEFGDPGVQFEGARVFRVGNQMAARLHYRLGDSRVTLMAFEATPAVRRALAAGGDVRRVRVGDRELTYHQVRGYTVPVLEHDGIVYAFTGDLDAKRLLELVATVRLP